MQESANCKRWTGTRLGGRYDTVINSDFDGRCNDIQVRHEGINGVCLLKTGSIEAKET